MDKIKKVLIVMIAIAFIITASFIGTLFWLQSKSSEAKKDNKNATHTEKVKTVVHKMENPILANLKDSTKNIRVIVELEIKDEKKDDKKFIEELSKNDGFAKTIIITVLRSKTVEEVTRPDAPLVIREEITEKLNEAYHTDKFIATNFTEFITQ